MNYCGLTLLILTFLLLPFQQAPAQQAQADSVVYAYLPYVKFDSDIGFEAGLSLNRYHYDRQIHPFRNLFELRTRATTGGLFGTRLAWEMAEPFAISLRSRFEFIGERQLNDIFFLPGNDTPFDQDLWDADHHFFDALGFELTYTGRYPLLPDADTRFDLLLLTGGITREAFDEDQNEALIHRELPYGYHGGWFVYAGTGLLFDSRNNEFDPRQGNYSRIEVTASPGLLISEHQMLLFQAESSQFYSPSFSDDFTIAARLKTSFASGDVPFWMLPQIGGEGTVRGYPAGRFRDNAAIITNLELRNWLLSFDFLNLRFGLTAFSDSGRVYDTRPEFSDLFSDFHRTWGGGPIVSAFTRDFIVRAQIGRSDEISRIYMNIGFTF